MLERFKNWWAEIPSLGSLLIATVLVLDGYCYPIVNDWLRRTPHVHTAEDIRLALWSP